MYVKNGEEHTGIFLIYTQKLCFQSIYMHLFLLALFGDVRTWKIAAP